ncbi:MAG: fumarylacetoacetate hydrolase family protein [Nitrospinaceae bacterium]|jgi:2-keto-4-pentenoate hydratase/2-oxohepta-3-ene-1,7-dioic acid hydratase in catechol pathway|nr:MAG: fumarylacetoacetate hydrolase family protein [Nitrospinaceae bacterium]
MMDEIKAGQREWKPGRVFLIGKNYREHVSELGDPPSEGPVVFMKPASSLMPPGAVVRMPSHGAVLHHEVEVVALIGREGRAISESVAESHVFAYALGVDLTLRDVQGRLKKQGLPWEPSKAFDESAPLGPFTTAAGIAAAGIPFHCSVNGQVRQRGHTRDMIYPLGRIIRELSKVWMLRPGDLIFTGTPAGVGPLSPGDTLRVESPVLKAASWRFEGPIEC